MVSVSKSHQHPPSEAGYLSGRGLWPEPIAQVIVGMEQSS